MVKKKTQQRINKNDNNIYRLSRERNETINHIISECSKFAQKKYKTAQDWVGKVIQREMCKTFQFYHANKWYMQNPAPVQENDTHKLLWDFDILTDHLISAKRLDLIITNKKRQFTKLSTLLSRLTTKKKDERKGKEG